ncbi:uncharacterized protein UBRO2_03951 [Ustilago bromivora]|uniref:Uncharacterized protein n=1 Tax=Ustilago bromivora TaxID=307758 RepID=A0A8H8QNT6_9BASI|nr:uncharacterized protein UBRO2_03951 [Ustilago bromivora]
MIQMLDHTSVTEGAKKLSVEHLIASSQIVKSYLPWCNIVDIQSLVQRGKESKNHIMLHGLHHVKAITDTPNSLHAVVNAGVESMPIIQWLVCKYNQAKVALSDASAQGLPAHKYQALKVDHNKKMQRLAKTLHQLQHQTMIEHTYKEKEDLNIHALLGQLFGGAGPAAAAQELSQQLQAGGDTNDNDSSDQAGSSTMHQASFTIGDHTNMADSAISILLNFGQHAVLELPDYNIKLELQLLDIVQFRSNIVYHKTTQHLSDQALVAPPVYLQAASSMANLLMKMEVQVKDENGVAHVIETSDIGGYQPDTISKVVTILARNINTNYETVKVIQEFIASVRDDYLQQLEDLSNEWRSAAPATPPLTAAAALTIPVAALSSVVPEASAIATSLASVSHTSATPSSTVPATFTTPVATSSAPAAHSSATASSATASSATASSATASSATTSSLKPAESTASNGNSLATAKHSTLKHQVIILCTCSNFGQSICHILGISKALKCHTVTEEEDQKAEG